MSDETPTRAGDEPVAISVEAGKNYHWCACGKSSNQPFCNGAHKDSAFSPITFSVEETAEVYLCMCKRTKNPPYCDGSHASG